MKKLLLICGLCALGLAAYVQAQPRGGQMRPSRMGMGGGGMMALEGDWTLICFELKVNDKTLVGLLPVFQSAWDQRKELMEGMQNGEIDRMLMMEEMAAIQEVLQQGYEENLSKEQIEQLTKLRSERMSGWQRGGQRGGGAGGRQGR